MILTSEVPLCHWSFVELLGRSLTRSSPWLSAPALSPPRRGVAPAGVTLHSQNGVTLHSHVFCKELQARTCCGPLFSSVKRYSHMS